MGVLHLLNSKIPETQRIRSGVWTEPEYVGKEFAWKCPRGSREVEVAAVTAEVEVVAEIADQLAEVVVVNVEVAQEAEAVNGVVPDVPHRIGQCRGVEVGLLLLQEDDISIGLPLGLNLMLRAKLTSIILGMHNVFLN